MKVKVMILFLPSMLMFTAKFLFVLVDMVDARELQLIEQKGCRYEAGNDKRVESAMISWTKKLFRCNDFGNIDVVICDEKCKDYKTGKFLDTNLYKPENITYEIELRSVNRSLELEIPVACRCVSQNVTRRTRHSHFILRFFGRRMNYAIHRFREASFKAKCKRLLGHN